MDTSFEKLGLSPSALLAVDDLGYETPTPVQAKGIPFILQGRDVCAAAETGTGKTAAFLLSTMSMMEPGSRSRCPQMLIITPTRELAQQIGDVCKTIQKRTGHSSMTVYGGMKYGPQITRLKEGVDILIATPGRLNDLCDRDAVLLTGIDILVIDEADRMLDMGFWPSMQQLIARMDRSRQTLLFSATLSRAIMNSVRPILNEPMMVEISQRGEVAGTVDQYIMPIIQNRKQQLIKAVLEEKGADRVIIFCRTRKRAEECSEQLRRAGYFAESIHADKSQHQRQRALDDFEKGKIGILVATDVLARGIDVPHVDYVVNYDLPDLAEDYIHRIGRTGRAGNVGYAISFVTRESRGPLKDIERLIGGNIPIMELENFELDPQIMTMKDQRHRTSLRARDIERVKEHQRKLEEEGIDPHSQKPKQRYESRRVVSASDIEKAKEARKREKKRQRTSDGMQTRPKKHSLSNGSQGRKKASSSASTNSYDYSRFDKGKKGRKQAPKRKNRS